MKEIIRDLLQGEHPKEFKDFLFEIQNQLVGYGYVEGFTPESRQKFASRFIRLHEFFSELEKREKTIAD
jgi:hypothetical protein